MGRGDLMADEKPQVISDGLVNVAANLGTTRDKAAHSVYSFVPLGPQELLSTYRSSWLPRAIVDIPAQDVVRKWRAWQAEADQITKIEREEKRLGLREIVQQAYIAARLYGGAAIYIGTNDRAPEKPLVPSKATVLRSLTVLTPMQITPDEISRDIDSGFYGRAEFYTVATKGGAQVPVHATRLVVFDGAQVPDIDARTTGWADSVLQSVMEAVLQADGANANIASLIFEAKVDVFRFAGIMELLRQGGDDLVTKRLQAQAVLKGINGAVVLDMDDEYSQKNASFASLPDLMDRFMQNVSGASRIPVTRLLGRSAAGLSGSGDGDERVYFDHINHLQSSEIEPAMKVLDECLIWAALGARPAEIFYHWNPLRQVSEKERAEIFKTTADAARALAGSAAGELLPIDALSDALVNELVEQGVLPGLEQKIEEYGSLAEQDDLEEEDPEGAKPPDTATQPPVADATPRTLYVRRDVLNAGEIIAWAKAQGFETTLPADDMHVTIAFSRSPVDWMKIGEAWNGKLELAAGGPRLMETFGEAKVLLFRSHELEWRHDAMKEAGASWDHPQYQPHITISYGPMPDGVEPYQGRIILGPERFEEVKADWQSDIREE
jgi:phage-related protein (TIGR01555 family)